MTLDGSSVLLRLAAAPACALVAMTGTAASQGPPGFTDVTVAAGVSFVFGPTPDTTDNVTHGGGTEGDFDDDGWPDLFVVGGGLTPDRLFMNNQDGTFTDMAPAAGLTLLYRGNGANAADYDSDGDLDIHVTSSGDVGFPKQNGQHKLWRNNGDLTFTDVAVQAGVNSTGTVADGASSAWGDYDLDGDLDLWACGFYLEIPSFKFVPQNKLFHNNLAETEVADFTDVTAAAGLVPSGGFKAYSAIFADMNGDRYPELMVAGDFGTTRYFKNDGDGTFTDSLPLAPGDTKVHNGMGSCIGDFDRDGRQDWFVSAIMPTWQFAGPDGNRLYMNLPNGKLQSLPESAGVNDGGWGWGSAAVDFDNDGWQDIIETNGWHACDPVTLECFWGEPTYIYRNNGDLTFSEVHAANGLVNTYQGRGLITLDYDRDGDMDVVILSNPKGHASEDPATGNLKLYRNEICDPGGPEAGANFLEVRLDTSGTPALAPDGLGADVSVKTGAVVQHVRVHAGSNYLSRSQLCAHFGLGAATLVDELVVAWPNGDLSVLAGVPANQFLTVSSDAATWVGLGFAKAGSNGLPQLAGSGPLAADTVNQLDLTGAAPSVGATLIFGLFALNAPFKGGTLVPAPFTLVPLATGPTGAMSLPFLFPAGVPAGLPLYFQFWISDPGASFGLSASSALQGKTS